VHTIMGRRSTGIRIRSGLDLPLGEQLAGEWTTQFVSGADAMTEQYQAAGIREK